LALRSRQRPAHGGQQRSVGLGELRAADLAAQDRHLMPQHDDLEVRRAA